MSATIHSWLLEATKILEAAGIETARLDALVLLEDALEIDRSQLLASPTIKLSAQQQIELDHLLRRRARHEPLAYIRGKTEFYGREFAVTPAVLVPRPESETMIELLKSLVTESSYPWSAPKQEQDNIPGNGSTNKAGEVRTVRIADVGTGSGALGITAVLELPWARVELLDIDFETLKVAQANVHKYTLDLAISQSDLLAKTEQNYDILLCNLPYVPDDYPINQAAAREPKLALFGGPDGLDLYRRLFAQVDGFSRQPSYILTEALPAQHAALQELAEQSGYQLRQTDDFIQVFQLQT